MMSPLSRSVARSLGPLFFLASLAAPQVLTSQYDNARTSSTVTETQLTPANVNPGQFGKLFSLAVDGDVYAQPLFVPRVPIPGKGTHDVIFVATEHNSVYAFDAAAQPATPLWKVNFNNPAGAVTPVPGQDVFCPFIQPEIGITPTPTIDLATGTLYVLARTKENPGLLKSTRYVHKLHALAITTGAEKYGGPAEIKANGFDGLHELPRAGLLLVNGSVILTWASSCDVKPYTGWVMAYDAQSLAQKAVLNVAPDAGESGIWQADMAPAADEQGSIYLATGNGKFTAATGGRDYGDSLLKLDASLKIVDFFTPFNERKLNAEDDDLGSGGPLLLPPQSGPHARLVLIGGKGGDLYSIDRDRMGKYHADADVDAVQRIHLRGGLYSTPAYWNGHVFALARGDYLTDFPLDRGQLGKPLKTGAHRFSNSGSTPVISSNGKRDAIVWLIESKSWNGADRPSVLHAYDAADVGRELFASDNSARDGAGLTLRFVVPTVAAGRVYVGAKRRVDVYGLR
jgi:hypothetical protein